MYLRQQPFTNEAVAIFAARSISPSATVVSGGLWCFGAVQIVGAKHERVVTGGGKVSIGLPQFRAVNTFLGNFKRSLGGTYHAFDFAKYAHRYLAEAQYRFNRRFNLRSILARLIRAACLTYGKSKFTTGHVMSIIWRDESAPYGGGTGSVRYCVGRGFSAPSIPSRHHRFGAMNPRRTRRIARRGA
ncbi:MAG: hypothetical protein EXR27_19620 [Betaproteobacteria bacterium]|nr:hypothetical protein [Betaproteobacteria bacterium]